MSDEPAFLNAILANPRDNAPRLVYADWLIERGDPLADAKAAFLRDTVRLISAGRKEADRLRRRLHDAAPGFPDNWLSIVSRLAIEQCGREFAFRCPKEWDALTATDDVKVRSCEECKRPVYYCTTIGEARAHASRGECVAVQLGIPRRPDDLEPRRMLLGKIAPDRRR